MCRAAPMPTPETEPYWNGAANGRLRLPYCQSCRAAFFYPREACPVCASTAIEWMDACGRGRLLSYTVSHIPTPGFFRPPIIAIVQLAEGPQLLTNIVGVDPERAIDELELDMGLRAEFEACGEYTLPVFAPDEAS